MEHIEYYLPEAKDRLLYLDNDLAAVLKVGGEICEGKKAESLSTVFSSIINEQVDMAVSLECPNRLDQPVSGLQLITLHDASLKHIANQFAQHRPLSTYWAVVEGLVKEERGQWHELTHHLSFNPSKKRANISDTEQRKSKKVCLEYRCIGVGNNYSYIEIKPKTERTHQIRSQLAYCGLRIKGDVKYGARRSDTLPGIRLHCASLEIIHPTQNKNVLFEAPLPIVDPLWESFLSHLETIGG